jgi:hypothetical protein
MLGTQSLEKLHSLCPTSVEVFLFQKYDLLYCASSVKDAKRGITSKLDSSATEKMYTINQISYYRFN